MNALYAPQKNLLKNLTSIISKEDPSLDATAHVDVLFKKDQISLGEKIVDRVEKSHDFLKKFSENKIIYGVNTGFGPMAQYKIADKDRIQLQFNLIQ